MPIFLWESINSIRKKRGDVPVVSSAGITGFHNKPLIDSSGIIIGRKGTVGNVTLCDEPFGAIDTAFYILDDPEKRDLYFTYYLLKNLDFSAMNSDSAVPGLNRDHAHAMFVKVPSIKEQKKIASILKLFDTRIKLLQQTNTSLESIAQALFKSWFIDFDPVHAKAEGREPEGMDAETAALFPDSFEQSEWGLVPIGWSIGKLGNILYVRGGYAYKSNAFCEAGFPVVKIKNIVGDGTVDLQNTVYIDKDLADKTSKFILQDGDIVIAMTGATIGKTGIIVTGNPQAPYLNQRVAKFESKLKNHCWLTYVALQNEFISNQVVDIASGSAQANISTGGIESIRLILPCHNELIEFFNEAVEPLFLRWIGNQKKINTLIKLRDALLPRLISGQLIPDRVGEMV